MSQTWKKYLLWFAQEHVEFRFEEIDALLSMLKISMKFVEKPTHTQPYWIVEFKSENDIRLLASRSVSLRSCLELWANANTISGLHANLKQYPIDLMEPYLRADKSFKIEVETFCKHFTQNDKVKKLEAFEYLPYNGPVKLKNPDICFQYIEYYGVNPTSPPDDPYCVFFGRWIANGLRQLIKHLSLKTRKFIGNTSMDAQLSLLMANQACVRPGDLTIDPFVGSGSLLVAAAHFGGYVFGTDIDFLMLHARTKPTRITQQIRDEDEGVRANMKQYDLEKHFVDVLVNDFAMSFWRDDIQFDSIITDPPYGIREAAERIGTHRQNYSIDEKHLKTHIPAKIEYGLSKIYADLLRFAVKHLRIGGRLVCWFPVYREDYSEDGLPCHSCMKLVANSEQILNKHTSRRLLTFVKVVDRGACSKERSADIQDFRVKYYETREESRQERRLKRAEERERGRLEVEKWKSDADL